MYRRPPRSTRTDTLFPYTTLFRSVATRMGQGGHIVASSALYGGSHNLFSHTLPRFGITTTKVHPRDHDGFRRAIRPETRLVFGETIGNPGLEDRKSTRLNSSH